MKAKFHLLLIIILAFIVTAAAQDGPVKQAPIVSSEKIVTDTDAVTNALKAGAKIPSFSLSDAHGKTVSSKDLLKSGNLVIVFYRGSWCPFCNTYLRSLQKRLKDINDAGGTLVAISVESPDASMEVAKKNDVGFTVLSDPGLETARKFGIVYQLSAETNEKYISFGLDLAKHNAMDKPELPLSATYVVTKKGIVAYAFLEPDYKKRAEPDVIIAELGKIKKPAK